MIKIAFWFDRPEAYTGGLNYLKNLLYAISLTNEGKVRPYVFVAKNMNAASLQDFAAHATVVRTLVLQRWTLPWLVHKALYRLFGRQWMVTAQMRKHGIDVVSHAEHVHGRGLPFRLIGWIPDFQYLHLPELFPGLDTQRETRRMRRIISRTDRVLLSSRAAYADFRRVAPPGTLDRARILHFVSQPVWQSTANPQTAARGMIESRYAFHGKYFFLPNQFWQHKNHQVAFEAVRLLHRAGEDVLLLCSGNEQDYRLRHGGYVRGLREFIRLHGLEENIRILGMIEYRDVLSLMRNCLAVLNPSRFEGWSSTVEEARSLGKRLILSEIPVHLEQDVAGAAYFPPGDPLALAMILRQIWNAPPEEWTVDQEVAIRADLRRRTLVYGRGYIDLVEEVMRNSSAPRPVGHPNVT